MSKELEALETLKDMLIGNGCNNSINDYVDELILPIKQALQRLEAIDKTNPSEALNCLEKLGNIWHTGYTGKIRETALYNTIKQALIKAQEQEKVLEIIKEKSVDIKHLKWCINNPKKLTTPLLNYNIDMNKNEELTEEEYDLLNLVVGK